jgi:hypothetical protein
MYYVGEIIDRTFANWSEIIGATDESLWTTSAIIETKPETNSDTTTSNPTPAENPPWEPADTNEWNEASAEQIDSNPISETLDQIAETAYRVIDDINPFTDPASDNR